jgi:surface polysaccharide O-acyltransferase-like enzyme
MIVYIDTSQEVFRARVKIKVSRLSESEEMTRYFYLDYLRIYATIAVVTIHVSASKVSSDTFKTDLFGWFSGNFYETLSRASVPIFVMISGALLLNDKRSLTISQFLKKRVNKVAIPLVAWSIIYYVAKVYNNTFVFSLKEFIYKFFTDNIVAHLWFMYTILGLYLITPLLKILVRNATKRDVEYFLGLWIFASIIAKLMVYLVGFSLSMELFFVTNYVGYFVLGYYLFKYQFSKKHVALTQISLVIGLLGTFFLTYYGTVKNGGILDQYWYAYHSVTVFMISVGIFTLFKDILYKSKLDINSKLNWFSQASFGIYLVHLLVLNYLFASITDKVWDHLHPIIGIPVNVAIVIIISAMITFIIQKIPVLKNIVP